MWQVTASWPRAAASCICNLMSLTVAVPLFANTELINMPVKGTWALTWEQAEGAEIKPPQLIMFASSSKAPVSWDSLSVFVPFVHLPSW